MQYCTATNTGTGFITHEEKENFSISGYSGDVWVVDNSSEATAWISKVSGVSKTKSQAQTIVDAQIATAQTDWDSRSDEYKTIHLRPIGVTLP